MTKTFLYLYRPHLVTAFPVGVLPACMALEKPEEGVIPLNAYLSVNDTNITYDCFYIVCDSRHSRFTTSMAVIEGSAIVEEILYISSHLVSIKVKADRDLIQNFILGAYSKMYPTAFTKMKCFEQALALRKQGAQALGALRHSSRYYDDVIYPLVVDYSQEKQESIRLGEYDSPPVLSDEILNLLTYTYDNDNSNVRDFAKPTTDRT